MKQPMTFGNYALLDRVSIGGMAEVYRAKRANGGNQVLAIKRILPALAEDQEFTKMFIDEATIAGGLNHQNIAKIIELGEQDGTLFIAMEYVWGKDMLQIVNRFRKLRQPMPIEMACYVLMRMLDGLDYAHRHVDAMGSPMAIVHRDCSPQNVLVAYNGDVKVIDFGIAKAASRASQTVAGVLKGKFSYMSPEQVRGETLDRRTDVFACGTVLYELLISDRLFTGSSDLDILEKVREVKVPLPSKADPRIDAQLEAIIMKALHKDPEQRYQWCSEYRIALEEYMTENSLQFAAADMSAWLRKAFAQEIEKELLDIGALRNATGHMVVPSAPMAADVAAEGTVQQAPQATPEATSEDPDGPTVFDPGTAFAAARAAASTSESDGDRFPAGTLSGGAKGATSGAGNGGAAVDEEGDDPLDEVNTGAMDRPSQVLAVQTSPAVLPTPANLDDADATSVVSPAMIAQEVARAKQKELAAKASAVETAGADARSRAPLDSDHTGTMARPAAMAAPATDGEQTGQTGRTGRSGVTGPTGQTANTGAPGGRSRQSLGSVDPVRRSSRMSAPGVREDTTNTGSRMPLRSSKEMRAIQGSGAASRRRAPVVSLGLSHDELFGDTAESEAEEVPPAPQAEVTQAAPVVATEATGTKPAAGVRSATSMGTAVPVEEGVSQGVVAAAVAGSLLLVGFLVYWFGFRSGEAPPPRVPIAPAVVKGRVVVQVSEPGSAEVFVDGTRVGITTNGEQVLSLPLGKHEVRVMMGDRQLCSQQVNVVDPAKLAAVNCIVQAPADEAPASVEGAAPAEATPAAAGAPAVAPPGR